MGTLAVPYFLPLDNKLNVGNTIIIRGRVTGANFVVNLATGPNVTYDSNGDNIVLHLSYRQKQNVFVLNSYDGNWGNEEKLDASGVQQGQQLELLIALTGDHFQIYVNNNHIGNPNYRLPLDSINTVHVDGAITLNSVERGGQTGQEQSDEPGPEPEPAPVPPEPVPAPQPEPAPQPGPTPGPQPEPIPAPGPIPDAPPVPYVLSLPSNFGVGHKLRINAIPAGTPTRFHVNFYVGFLNAFHYEPRFDTQIVKRNSRKQGEAWDKEIETDNTLPQFPFSPEKQFELVYVCENEVFQVFVDGSAQCVFKHRLPPNEIDAIGIEGDLNLVNVAYE